MTFTLDGGWGLLVVVGLWILVMVPSWGKSELRDSRVSTRSRNSYATNKKSSKNNRVGVSRKENFRNKNRRIRQFFATVAVVSLGLIVHSVVLSFTNLIWLVETTIAFAALSFSVSVLRNTRPKQVVRTRATEAQRAQDRARMAYFIRESALADISPDELFDERAWTTSQMPESSLNRQFGSIDMSKLADVVSLDGAREVTDDTKLDSDQLDQILKRRRTGN